MDDTVGKSITCKAAVAWEAGKPLSIETIEVAPPKAKEVRVKVLYSGVCHSDLSILNGSVRGRFPIILGHEGSGIVESVGEGVTDFQTGDHVIPLYLPQCNACRSCKSGKTNICEEFLGKTHAFGLLTDGTPRFTCNEKPVYHFMACSAFSQYVVLPHMSVCKIDNTAPLEKVCLLGCGIATGYGAALNTAKVEAGSTCAVWGLGPIGLSAVMGCKKAGASRIIGVDINPEKFELGKKFGLTEGINPKDHDKPIQEVLMGMTDGGVDYTFECIGNVNAMRAAFDSCHKGWGKTIVLGIAPTAEEFSTNPIAFTLGKHILGSIYGEWKGKDDVPKLIEGYNKKEILLDEFITHTMALEKINEAFDLMREGKSLRTVINLWPDTDSGKSEL
ncbi:alcohol dehydrogenase class-3-like [Mytilus trossulus]|uniref:alcohol dehydrogenase class-3-like n=1 Tax=Mytilus trossulus TaxID=6551 RepID=UPI003006540C